jgi:hypothetical protein
MPLAALPTIIIFVALIAVFVWLGRHHRRTWEGAPRQRKDGPGPVIRESTWMRGGGGQS